MARGYPQYFIDQVLSNVKTREKSGVANPEVLPGELDHANKEHADRAKDACAGMKSKDAKVAKGSAPGGLDSSDSESSDDAGGGSSKPGPAKPKKDVHGFRGGLRSDALCFFVVVVLVFFGVLSLSWLYFAF